MRLLTNNKAIEKFVSTEANKDFKFDNMDLSARQAQRACKCRSCGETHEANKSYLFLIPQNNGTGVCLCENCRGVANLYGYSDENTNTIGTPYKNTSAYYKVTSSHELETIGHSSTARASLCYGGYLPTYDCSLDGIGIEYKSPICYSASPFGILANTIEWLNEHCDFSTRDARVGCHTHFGLIDNSIDFRFVDYSVFDELHDYVTNGMTATQRELFFGRDFVGYADASIAQYHSSWINNEHKNTVEFRLCKFMTAKQYMTCYYALRDCFTLALKYWTGEITKAGASTLVFSQFRMWVECYLRNC